MIRLDIYQVQSNHNNIIDWAWEKQIAFDQFRSGLNIRVPLQFRREFVGKFKNDVRRIDTAFEFGTHMGYRN